MTASEVRLLASYAPDVSSVVLERLAASFSELRALVEAGTLSYPYSTREAVAVVKHLQQFPDDGVVATLENALAFDAVQYHLLLRIFFHFCF